MYTERRPANFEVLGTLVKHYLSDCLMYILYRNWKIHGNGEIKSTENSLLITEDKISKTSSRLWFSFDELWWIINEIAEKQISRFTSSLVPLFQNESKCETMADENAFCMQFHFHANQSHFHKNGFTLRIALKQRRKGTRKWSILAIFSE